MQQRYHELDLMRIFLLILVVIGHATYLNMGFGAGGTNYDWSGLSPLYSSFSFYPDKIKNWIYSFHMPLFFVLSGAVAFITREKTFASFDIMIISKLKRLLVPYFAYGLLFMLPVKYAAHGYTSESIIDGMRNFLSLSGDQGHLWFLVSLFWCFVFFYPLNWIYRKTNSICLLLLISLLIQKLFYLVPVNILSIPKAIEYLPYFSVGYVLMYFYKRREEKRREEKRVVYLIIFVFLAVINLNLGINLIPVNVFINGVWIYMLSSLIVEKSRITESKAFAALNRNNMRMYLFHDPLNYVWLSLASTYGLLNFDKSFFVSYTIRTIGIIVLSLALALLTQHIKNMKRRFLDCVVILIVAFGAIGWPVFLEWQANLLWKQTTTSLTDANWTNGVATFGNILLFENNDKYSELLLQNTPQTVTANGYSCGIVKIEERGSWIWVTIADGANKDNFQFPVELTFN